MPESKASGFSSALAAGSLVLAAASCTAPELLENRNTTAPLIYGTDDRLEVFEFGQASWVSEVARTTVVALGYRDELSCLDGITVDSGSVSEKFGVCGEERFAEQPAFAFCTAIAWPPDLLLTSRHCLAAGPLEDLVAWVGYHFEAEGRLASDSCADVYEISEVVLQDASWDFVWLRTSRALPESSLRIARAEVGMPLVSIGHTMGVPAKVDGGGSVFAREENTFISAVDAFIGSSGSPVFSRDGELLGLLTSGQADYEATDRDCLAAAHRADDEASANEQAVDAAVMRDALCAREPDSAPCGVAAFDEEGGCAIGQPSRESGRCGAGTLAWVLLGFAAAGRRWVRRRGPLPR